MEVWFHFLVAERKGTGSYCHHGKPLPARGGLGPRAGRASCKVLGLVSKPGIEGGAVGTKRDLTTAFVRA